MTRKRRLEFDLHRGWAVLLGAILLVALLPGAVLASNSVTAATGGTTISADTNTVNGNSGWTTLTGPTINGSSGTLLAGVQTFTIHDTGLFAFNPASGTAGTPSGAGCDTLGASLAVTATTATLTLTGASSGTCSVTISGLQVQPTAAGAAPLETSSIDAGGIVVGAGLGGNLAVVPGAAVVQFTQGTIGNVGAGAPLSPMPKVHDEDQYSNVRVGDSITLSIKPGSGASGAALSCTANTVLTDASGDAAFAACSINKAGDNYRLLGTKTGSTPAESNAFNVTAGAADKVVFTTQPSRGTPGAAFAGQPVVEIQDSLGNRVTSDSSTSIALTLSTNPGAGTLSCTGGQSKTVSSGAATFSGCSINNAAIGYKITATASPALPTSSVVSNLFDVADRLVFATEPSATTSAGIAFAAQPVVAVRAGTSNTAVSDQTTVVTLSLKAGTGATGATLTCDGGLSRTVVSGVAGAAPPASFTGCKIDKISPTSPANPYKIVATATNLPALTVAESTNVAITAGPAAKLGFTAQPTGGVATQAFPIQPVVAVQDAGGNTVTSGTNSTATVTLTLGAGAPAGSTLACTGGNAKAAVAGVATFAGCAINAAGTYTLVATASNLAASTTVTAATSNSFVVTAPVAAVTLTNSARVITWGTGVGLTIQFGTNGGNKTFALQAARDGVSFVTIATLTTNASGQATLNYRPATNLYYKVVFAGAPDLGAATSNTTRTVVRQIALLRPHHSATVSIARNSSITFTTTVRPSRPELTPAKVSFVLYRRIGSVWTLVTKRDVIADSTGLARTTFRFTRAGNWYVRSIANPTPYNANSVWSPLERYFVR